MKITNLDYWENNPIQTKISGGIIDFDTLEEEIRDRQNQIIARFESIARSTAMGTIAEAVTVTVNGVNSSNGSINSFSNSSSSGFATSTAN